MRKPKSEKLHCDKNGKVSDSKRFVLSPLFCMIRKKLQKEMCIFSISDSCVYGACCSRASTTYFGRWSETRATRATMWWGVLWFVQTCMCLSTRSSFRIPATMQTIFEYVRVGKRGEMWNGTTEYVEISLLLKVLLMLKNRKNWFLQMLLWQMVRAVMTPNQFLSNEI